MSKTFRSAAFVGLVVLLSGATIGALVQRAAEGSFEKTLNVSGSVDVDVSTGSGTIEVQPGAPDRVTIHAIVRVGEWRRSRSEAEELLRGLVNNPPIEQVGSVIRIGRNDDPNLRRDVAISYQITVPKETRLHALTGSGNQSIEGITGPADVQTGSGSIHLREVKTGVRSKTGSGSIIAENTGGGFEGHTGSGSVRFIQATPGDVAITTGSGSVVAAAVKGALSIHTGSGSVRAEGQPTGSWDFDTGSGSVKLALPPIGFNLNAHTGSGGITVNHPLIVQGTIKKNELIGTVRGGGIPIQIRTGSGSIRVE